jgi:hypothetical protein
MPSQSRLSRSPPMPRANDNSPLTEARASSRTAAEREAAQAALDAIRTRYAAGERIVQSAMADAVRRAAVTDLAAQHTKTWKPTP